MYQQTTKSAYLSRQQSSNNSLYFRILCRLERTKIHRQKRILALYIKAIHKSQIPEALAAWKTLYPQEDDT